MGCAHRRFGDHIKASECFKAALMQPDGEDAFQRVNTLMLLSNSLSSLQRYEQPNKRHAPPHVIFFAAFIWH